jgi:hypothetical protein
VEIFSTHGRRIYQSLEQAYMQILRSYQVQGEDGRRTAMDFLSSRLDYRDGVYLQPKDIRWALIWWFKD